MSDHINVVRAIVINPSLDEPMVFEGKDVIGAGNGVLVVRREAFAGAGWLLGEAVKDADGAPLETAIQIHGLPFFLELMPPRRADAIPLIAVPGMVPPNGRRS
jgi:hypothetical protein